MLNQLGMFIFVVRIISVLEPFKNIIKNLSPIYVEIGKSNLKSIFNKDFGHYFPCSTSYGQKRMFSFTFLSHLVLQCRLFATPILQVFFRRLARRSNLEQCFSTGGSRPTFGSWTVIFRPNKLLLWYLYSSKIQYVSTNRVLSCFVGRQNKGWEPLIYKVHPLCKMPKVKPLLREIDGLRSYPL